MDQPRRLKTFMLSEGTRYRDSIPERESLEPNQKGYPATWWSLAGWPSMMATADNALLIAYFEVGCPCAKIKNLLAGADGTLQIPPFAGGAAVSELDWALKMEKRS